MCLYALWYRFKEKGELLVDTAKLNSIVAGLAGVTPANQAGIVSTLNTGLQAGEEKPQLVARLTAAAPNGPEITPADADVIVDAVLTAKKAEEDAKKAEEDAKKAASKKKKQLGAAIAAVLITLVVGGIALWAANMAGTAANANAATIGGNADAIGELTKVVKGKQEALPKCGPNMVWKSDGKGGTICTVDVDTKYDGSNFATSGQACPTGEVATGVDANGDLTCVGMPDSATYNGTDFATSGQACPTGEVATGVDANGDLTCMKQAINTDKLAELNCQQGDVAMMDKGEWTCQSLSDINNKAQDALTMATENQKVLQTITRTVACRKSDPKCTCTTDAAGKTSCNKLVAIAYYGRGKKRTAKKPAAKPTTGTAAILLPGGKVQVGSAVCNGVYDAKTDRCNGQWHRPSTTAGKTVVKVKLTGKK